MQVAAIESDRHHVIIRGTRWSQRPGANKFSAITREPAGDFHLAWKYRLQPGNQRAAIDRHTGAKEQNRGEIFSRQRLRQPRANRKRFRHRRNANGFDVNHGSIKLDRRDTGSAVVNTIAVYFARRRATSERRVWKSPAQCANQRRIREEPNAAKYQHQSGTQDRKALQIRVKVERVFQQDLLGFHSMFSNCSDSCVSSGYCRRMSRISLQAPKNAITHSEQK